MHPIIIKTAIIALVILVISALIFDGQFQRQKIKTVTASLNAKSAEIALAKQSSAILGVTIDRQNEALITLETRLNKAKAEAASKINNIETAYKKKLSIIKNLPAENNCEATVTIINQNQQIFLTEGHL